MGNSASGPANYQAQIEAPTTARAVSFSGHIRTFAAGSATGKSNLRQADLLEMGLEHFMSPDRSPAQQRHNDLGIVLVNRNPLGFGIAVYSKGESSVAYQSIDGVQYEKELLDLAKEHTTGRGEGKISKDEVADLLKSANDGQGVTETEKRTLAYIRKNFEFTGAAAKDFDEAFAKL